MFQDFLNTVFRFETSKKCFWRQDTQRAIKFANMSLNQNYVYSIPDFKTSMIEDMGGFHIERQGLYLL